MALARTAEAREWSTRRRWAGQRSSTPYRGRWPTGWRVSGAPVGGRHASHHWPADLQCRVSVRRVSRAVGGAAAADRFLVTGASRMRHPCRRSAGTTPQARRCRARVAAIWLRGQHRGFGDGYKHCSIRESFLKPISQATTGAAAGWERRPFSAAGAVAGRRGIEHKGRSERTKGWEGHILQVWRLRC